MRVSSTSELTGEHIGVLDVYGRVFKNYFINPITIGLIAVIIVCLVIIIKDKLWKNALKDSIPYMVILLMPLAWYMFAFGHTFDHHFFTYKGLMVFTFAILCILIKIIDKNGKMEEKNKKVKII
jgi:hypothetical protein